MDTLGLKNIMNRDRKWLEELYYLLWELFAVALSGAVFWLMYKCVVW
jgi:hypothetical protein